MRTHITRLLYALAVTGTLLALGLAGCALQGPGAHGAAAAPTTVPAPEATPATARAPEATPAPAAAVGTTLFAVIGDFGMHDAHEAAVAKMVRSWHPAFIVTTGDDYYTPAGGKGLERYYRSAGYLYGHWMAGVPKHAGRVVGTAKVNAFFSSIGNEDYTEAKPGPQTYLGYFTLPGAGFTSSSGNERYYDFVEGPIHFFIVNSNPEEPSGVTSSSVQALWLKQGLASSASSWNVVVDHHPPYSSDTKHHSTPFMQWPFAEWGADVVLSGHAHTYERLQNDGITYFVNGLGGGPRYKFGPPVPGSIVRYSANWGAMKVAASSSSLRFEFYSVRGKLIDRYTLTK